MQLAGCHPTLNYLRRTRRDRRPRCTVLLQVSVVSPRPEIECQLYRYVALINIAMNQLTGLGKEWRLGLSVSRIISFPNPTTPASGPP